MFFSWNDSNLDMFRRGHTEIEIFLIEAVGGSHGA